MFGTFPVFSNFVYIKERALADALLACDEQHCLVFHIVKKQGSHHCHHPLAQVFVPKKRGGGGYCSHEGGKVVFAVSPGKGVEIMAEGVENGEKIRTQNLPYFGDAAHDSFFLYGTPEGVFRVIVQGGVGGSAFFSPLYPGAYLVVAEFIVCACINMQRH